MLKWILLFDEKNSKLQGFEVELSILSHFGRKKFYRLKTYAFNGKVIHFIRGDGKGKPSFKIRKKLLAGFFHNNAHCRNGFPKNIGDGSANGLGGSEIFGFSFFISSDAE